MTAVFDIMSIQHAQDTLRAVERYLIYTGTVTRDVSETKDAKFIDNAQRDVSSAIVNLDRFKDTNTGRAWGKT